MILLYSTLIFETNNLQECFVDKSRQMSFMMGSKDLCTNLKLQEKKKRFDSCKHLLPLITWHFNSFLGKLQDRLEGEAIYFKEREVYLMMMMKWWRWWFISRSAECIWWTAAGPGQPSPASARRCGPMTRIWGAGSSGATATSGPYYTVPFIDISFE